MRIPLQLTFRGMESSEAVSAKIRQEVEKLEQFNTRISSCRVVVGAPSQRHRHGAAFSVHLDLTVPGHKEIAVTREPEDDPRREDAYAAIHDAFAAARRQLQDHVRKRRDQEKHSAQP